MIARHSLVRHLELSSRTSQQLAMSFGGGQTRVGGGSERSNRGVKGWVKLRLLRTSIRVVVVRCSVGYSQLEVA